MSGLGARLALSLQARALQARTEALYRRSEHTARTLQQSLLPAVIPDFPSCELAIRFAPAGAGDLVGGDFYDVFAVGDDHWAVVVGDVCGKGAQAAAVTAMARWMLRSFAGRAAPPADVLRALNEAMLRQDLGGRFITIVYALISVSADEAHVTVACAGPSAGAVRLGHRRAGGAGRARRPARDLARDPARQVDLRLAPGDSLVLYTDGVTDQGPGSGRSPEHAIRSSSASRAPTRSPMRCATRPSGQTRWRATTWRSWSCDTWRGRRRTGPAPRRRSARRTGLTAGQPRA